MTLGQQEVILIDTSIIIASLDPDEPHHIACDLVFNARGLRVYSHALTETFSILTGGRLGRRLSPATASGLIRDAVLPNIELVSLSGKEIVSALSSAGSRGARGGAVYELMHLIAARKCGATKLLTLNLRNFVALAKPGDPPIEGP